MDVSEKLVELLNDVQETGVNEIPAGFGCTREYIANEKVASHLTANGVTVQEDCNDCAEATQNCIVKLQEKIEELRSAQEWVPVKDGLPERPPDRVDEQGRSWFTPNIDCIVYDGKSVFAANYCFQNKCFWYADTLHPLKNITHWMPMPQPPKGE